MQNIWPARNAVPARPQRTGAGSCIVGRVALSVVVLVAAACASGRHSELGGSTWQDEMRAGVESSEEGDEAAAAAAFGRAVGLARLDPLHSDELAYASWHLGDVCFHSPDLCPAGEAERETQISYDLFAAHYGPEHPVVIPILLRLSALHEQRGDAAGAKALLDESDEITARTFPASHFMRAGSGSYRPAASLHPQEILEILSEMDLLGG